jgi:hypothetical protein
MRKGGKNMTKNLVMVFRNNSGKEVTISLADPKDELTKAQAETLMKSMLDKNIFTTTGGDLKEIVEARISTSDSVVLA